jgi:trk system potassium uptake protein TrkA
MASKRDFVVFGLGKFGSAVAQTLTANGCDVLAIDKSEEIIQDISDYVTHAVQADVTDADALQALGIRNFDVAVVAISNDMQSSVMATILAKEMGVGYVVAKAKNDIHKRVLEKVGADRVIFPEREIGIRIANNLTSDSFVDFIELSDDFSIGELEVKEQWKGRTIREIDMRNAFGINVIGMRQGETMTITPGPDKLLELGEILIVIGTNANLKKLSEANES